MRIRPVFAFLLSAVVLSPAPALAEPTFLDTATGLELDLPAAFAVIGRQDRTGYDVAVGIKAATPPPTAVNPDGSLCGVAYASAPANEGLGQDRINALVREPGWLPSAGKTVSALGQVKQSQVFVQPGAGEMEVAGGEFVVAPSAGPNAEAVTLYLAMWETPKGRVVVSCAGLSAETPLEAFRAVRRAVRAQ